MANSAPKTRSLYQTWRTAFVELTLKEFCHGRRMPATLDVLTDNLAELVQSFLEGGNVDIVINSWFVQMIQKLLEERWNTVHIECYEHNHVEALNAPWWLRFDSRLPDILSFSQWWGRRATWGWIHQLALYPVCSCEVAVRRVRRWDESLGRRGKVCISAIVPTARIAPCFTTAW